MRKRDLIMPVITAVLVLYVVVNLGHDIAVNMGWAMEQCNCTTAYGGV